MLKVGKAVRAHGVRGSVKVLHSMDPGEITSITRVIIDSREYDVERVTPGVGCAYFKLVGISDMTTADAIRGDVYVDDEHRPSLPEGTYYVDDLKNLDVKVDGETVGVLRDILQYGAADVYCVRGADGKPDFMFPNKVGVIVEHNLKLGYIALDGEELSKVAVNEN